MRAESIHRIGKLDVRLASSEAEIAAAQALRYQVFYEEMGAVPDPVAARSRLDIDLYDGVCDHLLVIDETLPGAGVVGTYRLLRQQVADAHLGFYSTGEYDLTPLERHAGGQLLELGRSCVAPAYRTNATIGLLWRGIASYLRAHEIAHMFGCASLHGTDPDEHAAALSYLHHHHLAPPELRARALPEHHVRMDRIELGAYDVRAAARSLPPLVKGYLRVGAMVGDGAFIDRQFNTTDIFVVMPVAAITQRYLDRFAEAA